MVFDKRGYWCSKNGEKQSFKPARWDEDNCPDGNIRGKCEAIEKNA